jgi:hypothetical protein
MPGIALTAVAARPGLEGGLFLEPGEPSLEFDVADDPAEHAQQVHQPTEQGRVDAAGFALPIERSQVAPDRFVIPQ